MAEGKYSFETGKIHGFSVVDYVLFGLMLAFSATIGVFYAIKDRKRSNTKEFLLAGGNMNPIPVSLSILASFMSAITLLGTPAEMYNYTTMYFYIGLGYLFVVAGAAHLFIPIFYKLRCTSAYEVSILSVVPNFLPLLGVLFSPRCCSVDSLSSGYVLSPLYVLY